MMKKLLNLSKNLIISILLVVITMLLFFTTRSYAAGETLGQLMRVNVGSWYFFILRICLIVYAIGYFFIVVKMLANRTPETIKTLKESLLRFFIMLMVLIFLHYIMIFIITVNERGVALAKKIGSDLSGIGQEAEKSGKTFMTDEDDLYETALSKAYEIAIVPGFIGLVMYLLLVFYTYKFAIVYIKRYINIIILILLAPIIIVISTMKKIITGVSDGLIKRLTKEFIFSVIIQTLHAIFYATLIGFALSMSDKDENSIGILIVLILLGFIFKIDQIVRKLFNFVGGSTNISSSKALNTVGNVVDKGVSFGKDVKENGFGKALENDWKATKNDFATAKNSFVTGIKTKTNSIVADAKDIKNIMNGDRVRENLSKEEIVNQIHVMDEAKGLEGVRQGIQASCNEFTGSVKNFGKYTSKTLKQIYSKVEKNTKEKMKKIKDEYHEMIDELENNYETVKKLPKIFKNIKKKKKYIKNADGFNLDADNAMMLVVDTDGINPQELLESLKEQYGDDIDVQAFVFENIGAQTFLSPATASMGMAVLAEDNYEKIAEHRFDDELTDKKRKKRKVKRASTRQSKSLTKKASKSIKENEHVSKVYKFNRFNPNTARKITRKMLDKSVQQNRYLIVINRTYDDIQTGKLKVRGRISSKINAKNAELQYRIKAKRRNFVHSIRQIKLKQKIIISKYKEIQRKAKGVQRACNVANIALNAKRIIELEFKKINEMTPGKLKLQNMIKTGQAYQLSNNLVMMQKNMSEERIKATGIFIPEKNAVLQFVIEGTEIKQQFVGLDGTIIRDIQVTDNENISITNLESIVQSIKSSNESNTQQSQNQVSNTSENISQNIVQIPSSVNQSAISSTISEGATIEQPIQHPISEEDTSEITQRIVDLEGNIIEQVIRDGKIETDEYTIINNGGTEIIKQISETFSNEEVGVSVEASEEEKFNKFEELMRDMQSQTLLEQVVQQSSEEEKVLDEIIVMSAFEAQKADIRTLDFNDNQAAQDAAIERMVNTGILTEDDLDDDDIVGNALDILNSRVQTLSSNNSDILFNKAAEMEYVRFVEEALNKGEFENTNQTETVNVAVDVDKKMNDLSDLLIGIAEESSRFPREVLSTTVDAMSDVMTIYSSENNKTPAQIEFEKELKKAEREWAKKHKTKQMDVVSEYNKSKNVKAKKDDSEDEMVKITLRFYGGVENQGQSVTLSNRNSIKDFYDKASKSDDADLNKTQEYFLQTYGDKLNQMQLMPFSFAKCPVLDMDGWSIYIVTKSESVETGEKQLGSVTSKEESDKDKETADELLHKYHSEIRDVFQSVVQEEDIVSFNFTSSQRNRLIDEISRIFRRKGIDDYNEKAKIVTNNLYGDIQFKNIIDKYRKEKARKIAADKIKEIQRNMTIKSEAGAEDEFSKQTNDEEAEKIRHDLEGQVATEIVSEMLNNIESGESTDDEEDPGMRDLLDKIQNVEIHEEDDDQKELQFVLNNRRSENEGRNSHHILSNGRNQRRQDLVRQSYRKR